MENHNKVFSDLAAESTLIEVEQYYQHHRRDINTSWKNPEWDENTVLIRAAENGNYETVKWLLHNTDADVNARNELGRTALHRSYDNENVARMLLEHGIDIHAKDKYGNSAICDAARLGYDKVVEILVKFGANVNDTNLDSCTPLILAAEEGYEQVAAILVENGANVNAKSEQGKTALHVAAAKKSAPMVRLLLEHEVDVNERDQEGNTALAVTLWDESLTLKVLDCGVNIDAQNTNLETALHWAAYYGNKNTVRLLLNYGADRNLKDKRGRTPIEWAHEENQYACVSALKFHKRKMPSGSSACTSIDYQDQSVASK